MLGGIDVVHNDARFAVFNNACKRWRTQRLSDALAFLRPNSVLEEMPGDRSINRTRVDVDKTELSRKLPRNAALPRGSRTINGDHTMLGSV
jgi:hypothetical protein